MKNIMRPLFLITLALTTLGIAMSNKPVTRLILAHNLDTNHPVHKAMEHFRELVAAESEGRLRIEIYPNGQLGTERDVIELLQLGAVAMTKVSSMSLESFSDLYGGFNLPYIFQSKDHFYRVLDGPIGQKMFESTRPQKFVGLAYYDSGARSFYASKPILHPDDLNGLKIRVMGSPTAIRMMKLLGGSPTPMSYGEIYTGLQQKVIDGAENNPTALTLSRHGEVAKHFSLDEHAMFPDVLLISTSALGRLSEDERLLVRRAARASTDLQRKLWAAAEERELKRAHEELGVQVHQVEKAPFVERVRGMHEEFASKSERHRELVEGITRTPF